MILIIERKLGRPLLELIGRSLEMASKTEMRVGVLLMGEDEEWEEALEYGIDELHVASHSSLRRFSLPPFLRIAERIVKELDPEVILSPANTFGRTLMPALAAKLRTGLTADCTGIDFDENGEFLMTRPAIGGNVMATIVIPKHRPKMATVRIRVFEPAEKKGRRKNAVFKVWKVTEDDLRSRVKLIAFEEKRNGVVLEEADVVVAVGKGLRRKENLEVARKLAEMVGGAVGASRAVVDAGWISHDHQVGLSGKTVKPKIYIAAGISGAVQHIAGMQGSEIVVAINKDRYAPIFKVADIGIVADAKTTLEEIIGRLRSWSTRG